MISAKHCLLAALLVVCLAAAAAAHGQHQEKYCNTTRSAAGVTKDRLVMLYSILANRDTTVSLHTHNCVLMLSD